VVEGLAAADENLERLVVSGVLEEAAGEKPAESEKADQREEN